MTQEITGKGVKVKLNNWSTQISSKTVNTITVIWLQIWLHFQAAKQKLQHEHK